MSDKQFNLVVSVLTSKLLEADAHMDSLQDIVCNLSYENVMLRKEIAHMQANSLQITTEEESGPCTKRSQPVPVGVSSEVKRSA